MKKGLLSLFILLLVATAGIYLLIPREITLVNKELIGAPVTSTARLLSDTSNWNKWWPSAQGMKDTLYYIGYTFLPQQHTENKYQVLIKKNDTVFVSTLGYLPIGDSTEVQWLTKVPTGNNPVTKIRSYMRARKLSNYLAALSLSLKNYLEGSETVYGFKIERATIPSAHILEINASYDHYPNAGEIYANVNLLNKHLQSTEAQSAGPPMLHVTELGERRFQVTFGIPVDREVPGKGKITSRRMVTTDAITTKAKGGSKTTRQALAALYDYLRDNKLKSTAVPFESLLTDRSAQQDTSMWETLIYLPVN